MGVVDLRCRGRPPDPKAYKCFEGLISLIKQGCNTSTLHHTAEGQEEQLFEFVQHADANIKLLLGIRMNADLPHAYQQYRPPLSITAALNKACDTPWV